MIKHRYGARRYHGPVIQHLAVNLLKPFSDLNDRVKVSMFLINHKRSVTRKDPYQKLYNKKIVPFAIPNIEIKKITTFQCGPDHNLVY